METMTRIRKIKLLRILFPMNLVYIMAFSQSIGIQNSVKWMATKSNEVVW
jgi:hypothetical protein